MRKHFPRGSRGFTLVEMMVGVLIGLIGTVVIFQVFAVSEAQKRTTMGAGDAQQNGVFSLFQLERDARMAGFGINHMTLMGCQVNGWNTQTGQPIAFPLLPITITNGAGGAPDSVTIAYGDADLFSAPDMLRFPMTGTADYYRVRYFYGYRPGDTLVAAESGKPCTLAQVSSTGGSDVNHVSGSFTNLQGQIEATRFNRPGGLPAPNNMIYTAYKDATQTGGRLFNLGPRPVVMRYSLVAGQLSATDLLSPGDATATVAIADGIVQMQAQYGFDANGDGRLGAGVPSVGTINVIPATGDQWGDAMPAGAVAADWAKVIAVRLVVVARSITPERPDPGTGLCNTTTVLPKWVAPAPPAGIDLDVTAAFADANEWRCYRYRTFEVVVPLRNMVWFAQPT
ncbi:MAG: PilW family protein [Betaproteobacteria bacterium]|nr:PilW family protein [Betaproteobacteria bacterium]